MAEGTSLVVRFVFGMVPVVVVPLSVTTAASFSTLPSVNLGSLELRLVTVCITANVPRHKNNPTAAKRPSIERVIRTRRGDSGSVMAVPGLGIMFGESGIQ